MATYLPVAIGSVGWIGLHDGLDVLVARIVGESVALDLLAGLLPALLVVAASRWLAPRFTWTARMERALARLMGPLSWSTCFVLAAASAIGEELLFRGALQPALGLVATSLLFAIVHVPVDRDLALWPTFALGAGLLLGGLFELSGALVAPIVCHFTINLLNLRTLATRAAHEDDGFFQ